MEVNHQQTLLSLLERPAEPIFVPKGDGPSFDVPPEFVMEEYQPVYEAQVEHIRKQMAEETDEDAEVEMSESQPYEISLSVPRGGFPSLEFAEKIGRRDNFSLFVPLHQKIASKLISLLMTRRTVEDFENFAAYARDRINPYLFVYALSVATLHRRDTKKIQLPPLSELFPDKFVDGGVFVKAREVANIVPNEEDRIPIEIPKDYTANDLEPEHRVAYFREDIGVNLHHWHWHLVYPSSGPLQVIKKDRRGELFYYMHQQALARYNIARLCERLGLVRRLTDFRAPIEEGYFPKLDNLVASGKWPARNAGAILHDINRPDKQLEFDISDVERWRDRIVEAIQVGKIIDDQGKEVELTETEGIDILGNIIEACELSRNFKLYGNFHNMGHMLIGFVHDPDQRHLESYGVMGDAATAMRDPVFYRWHATINDLFKMHKKSLPQYTPEQLSYKGIKVTDVEVVPEKGSKNTFQTFWQKRDIDLSRGMDFAPRGAVLARVTHLQHTAFSYKIQVENNSSEDRKGTVRIFLAPKYDERGEPMEFQDQRSMMVEMDKFQVTIKKDPKSTITRDSHHSSITIPFGRTFRDLKNPPDGEDEETFNYCGCGWPEHMLVPKGTPEGFPCQLFVMISNYADDKVDGSAPGEGTCAEASSFCGIRDRKYPDKRSMGFPFDRVADVDSLEEFLKPNMAVIDVTIKFENRVDSEVQGPSDPELLNRIVKSNGRNLRRK